MSNRVGNKFVRVTDDREKPRLYLYHVESKNIKYWHGVANIQGFFKASYFCHTCLKPYKNKASHSCATSCDVCLHDNCKKTDVQIGCHSCNRICRSRTCFQRHKTQRMVKNSLTPLPVSSFINDENVELLYNVLSARLSYMFVRNGSPICREYHIGEHYCYQKPFASQIEKRKKKFIFYDFETRQDDIYQCEQGFRPSCIQCSHCVREEQQCSDCKLCQH